MIGAIGAIGRWWRKRQRRIDMEILWPSIKDDALHGQASKDRPSLYLARSAFRMHCLSDPAWTKDLSLIQIEEIVGRLS